MLHINTHALLASIYETFRAFIFTRGRKTHHILRTGAGRLRPHMRDHRAIAPMSGRKAKTCRLISSFSWSH